MFAIYNIQGRRFRDNLENLKKVHQPHTTEKSDFHMDIAQDETVIIQGSSSNEQVEAVAQKGAKAYRDMLHVNDRTPICHVYQLMSHPVATILINASIEDAYRYFMEHNFNQMPVLNQRNQIVGLITLKGLLKFMTIDGKEVHFLENKKVSDVMSTEVITADPVSDVRRVASVMLEYRLDGVPIVNTDDHLIGIVSRSDIIRAVINDPPLSLWS